MHPHILTSNHKVNFAGVVFPHIKIYICGMKAPIIISYALLLLFLTGCKSSPDPSVQGQKRLTKKATSTSQSSKMQGTIVTPIAYVLDSLPLEEIRINGHKPLLIKSDFDEIYPKKNEMKKFVWECGSPLDVLDKDWMTETYGAYDQEKGTFGNYDGQVTTITVRGARFATNDHLVLLIDAGSTQNKISIPSYRILLDSGTTTAEFEQLFPELRPEKTEDLKMHRYRIPLKINHPDAFLFYFKNGKFDHIDLWFLLC